MTKNMANCNFDALEILTKASSKDVVVKTCNEAFIFRNRKTYPNEVIAAVSQNFSCDVKESKQLLQNLGLIIKTAVFQGSTDPNVLVQIFPGKFHKNLRDLLIKTMMSNLDNWKNQAINGQVSLPRLLEFDWRVDIKTSSDSVARMSVPTCILQLQVQENKTKVEETPDISFVNVELSKETLDTMLDGLSKIRDQLSSVAKR